MNFSIIIGFERKGHKLRSEDYGQNFIRVEYYPYENLYNLKDILALQRATPIFYLKWYKSTNYGVSWTLEEQDIDCPFRPEFPIITGFTRRGERAYSQNHGVNWTTYQSPRDFIYFQYFWILAIQRQTSINNTISSIDYGQTWINTADIKVASVESYINRIYVIITKSEVKVEKESELPLPEELFERMLSYLPKYERTSEVFRQLIASQAKEIYQLLLELESIEKQLFVATADWGLDFWEEFLGLSKEVLTDEARRERMLLKLISKMPATLSNTEKLASRIINKQVKIVEDYENQSILIKSYENGIPEDSLYLYTYIRDFIPAHLGIVFEYRLWDWLDSREWTWDYFDSLNLTWDKYKEIDEEVDKVA